ncbi:MAG: hypothetical protein ACRDFB_05230 [Rhabdochlamydiaceae bacterium]
MELHAEGLKDREIAEALSEHEVFKHYPMMDTNAIKQIRYRIRNKK